MAKILRLCELSFFLNTTFRKHSHIKHSQHYLDWELNKYKYSTSIYLEYT